MTTNTTPQQLRKYTMGRRLQDHRKREMPTSSQALILLNSELDSPFGLYSTRVRRAVTSTAGLMLSSLAISVPQGQITTTTTTTTTTGFNGSCNVSNSLKDSGTMTVTATNYFNSNTRSNDNQQGDSLQKEALWLPRSSCSTNFGLNNTYPVSDSVQYRSSGRPNGGYHYRQPLILNNRQYPVQTSHDRYQQSTVSPRDPSEEAWPMLDVRKSQQFYRPLQSLQLSTSIGDLLLPSSNTRQNVALSETTPPIIQQGLNPINRRLIQRLRELGFRPQASKGQNKNVSNGIEECNGEMQHNEGLKKKIQFNVASVLRKSEKSPAEDEKSIVSPGSIDRNSTKEAPSIPLITPFPQHNPETNGHGLLVGNLYSKKDDHSEETTEIKLSRHQKLQNSTDKNLDEKVERVDRVEREADDEEREKVDQLVANLQAGMRQRKYKPPSIRMRKELPEARPLSVCFGCGSNVHTSHEDIKRDLELQYPNVSIVSLQFDPVSMNIGDPTTRNRWIVTLGKQDDCQVMMKGGVFLTSGDRVSVRPLDDVMREEHNAYKLHQYVQEAKAKVSLMKDDNVRKPKRSKNKGKPKKKKVTVK